MKIKNYIQGVLRERLVAADCLVLYDPERRFHAPALGLASDACTVVDTSASSIQGRGEATSAWLTLGQAAPGARQLLIYVPRAKPLTDPARQQDPFQVFAIGGAEFPHGEGDTYLSLCLAAKPDHESRVYALFDEAASREVNRESSDNLENNRRQVK